MALKSTYTKADLKDLVFFYADHSSLHYNYGGTPCSDHPLVKGTQGRNYDYGAWIGNGPTIFQITTFKLVLADNGVMPYIRAISPFDFGIASGTPPTLYSGNTSNITALGYSLNSISNFTYAAISKIREVIKKIFTTQNVFSKPHNVTLGNTIFSTSYATNLLNSLYNLFYNGDFVNYNLERLGAVDRSNGNWAESFIALNPLIDNIITNYANSIGSTNMEVYRDLYQDNNLDNINIIMYWTTSANNYNPDVNTTTNYYMCYYITEIHKIPSAMRKLDFYNIKRIQDSHNEIKAGIESQQSVFNSIEYDGVYARGTEFYNSAKSTLSKIR